MHVAVDPAAIVIRFSPTQPDKVLRRALQAHRQAYDESEPDLTYYRLSVWADTKHDDESVEALHSRLIRAAELGGINLETNRRYWTSTAARRGGPS